MSNSQHIIFDELYQRYFKAIEHGIKNRLKKARDKTYTLESIKNEVDAFINHLIKHKYKKTLAEDFLNLYKQGEQIEKILDSFKEEYGQDFSADDFKKLELETGIKLFDEEEDNKIRRFAQNDRQLTRFLFRYLAFLEISERLPGYLNELEKKEIPSLHYPIKWTGGKENKNEFVQLIYGLHSAGYINNGKGEITKIVESLAELFQTGLSKNWQSNHSSSIHKSKRSYEPPVFDKIKEAYKLYSDEMIEGKRKRK